MIKKVKAATVLKALKIKKVAKQSFLKGADVKASPKLSQIFTKLPPNVF